jgi:hypothetical protein
MRHERSVQKARKQKRPPSPKTDIERQLAELRSQIASLTFLVKQARDYAVQADTGTRLILSEMRD